MRNQKCGAWLVEEWRSAGVKRRVFVRLGRKGKRVAFWAGPGISIYVTL